MAARVFSWRVGEEGRRVEVHFPNPACFLESKIALHLPLLCFLFLLDKRNERWDG